MTRDEKERLTALEVQMSHHGELLSAIKEKIDVLHDAHTRRQGADGARKRLVSWMHGMAMLTGSLFGGGIGAIVVKKLG